MRIAIYQGPADGGDVAYHLARLDDAAARAAASGARLLICPEMVLTGYNIGAEARRLAEPPDGPSARQVAETARSRGVAVLYSYPELSADGAVHIAAQLVDRDGARRAHYRKSHLFGPDERALFAPGDGDLAIAALGDVRVGVLICYDLEFPEAVRRYALAGVDLVAVPTALMEPFDVVTRILVPARAYENQVFVAYANRCGHEGDLVYCGQSCVVGPDGEDLARAGAGEELLVADIEPASLAASRRVNTHLGDRRPDLYHALAAEPDSMGARR